MSSNTNSRNFVLPVALLGLALALTVRPARAQLLYGADGAQGNPANLYVLDPADGSVLQTVGPIGYSATGMAVDPTSEADLGVNVVATPDVVSVGNLILYRITATNSLDVPAVGVAVTETLPPSVTFVAASGFVESEGGVTCSMGAIPAKSEKSVHIVVATTSTGTICNDVEITSGATELNPGDNEMMIETDVVATADLDKDGDVDLPDFIHYQLAFTGSL
jgi:uncharacterized repeat protein (TIGR01451 family)